MEHIRTLEDYQESFDKYIAAQNWSAAQAIIDDMREDGFEHYSTVLRRVYLRAQFESVEEKDGMLEYIPYDDSGDIQEWSEADTRAWGEPEVSQSKLNPEMEAHEELRSHKLSD